MVSQNNTKDSIRVTRNLRASRLELCDTPISLPEPGVLYVFNVSQWEDKHAFYDKVAYSFGVPSTQKPVFCFYLDSRVMHYERTCQGVYHCPKGKNEQFENGYDPNCTVLPCRYRCHSCSQHAIQLRKSKGCRFKLHFYIPLDENDNRRALLCLGEHNHPLLRPKDVPASRRRHVSNKRYGGHQHQHQHYHHHQLEKHPSLAVPFQNDIIEQDVSNSSSSLSNSSMSKRLWSETDSAEADLSPTKRIREHTFDHHGHSLHHGLHRIPSQEDIPSSVHQSLESQPGIMHQRASGINHCSLKDLNLYSSRINVKPETVNVEDHHDSDEQISLPSFSSFFNSSPFYITGN
eukprot:gb/GECH01003438.1/.p1 GENE.gb/GECH01003438.1/~~gb/GECH01003438.1/.p1  ORF type:complete len:347 (+),score=52.11 gb/GECH01003438.1/:1-1041(+)